WRRAIGATRRPSCPPSAGCENSPCPISSCPATRATTPRPRARSCRNSRWEALLDTGIREMESLHRRLARAGASSLGRAPKKLLPDLYYLGEVKGGAVYGFFSSSKFFIVNAPGGPELVSSLEARLRQLGVKLVAPTAVLLTSGDPDQIAGLPALIEKDHPLIVAPPSARDAIKNACPPRTRILSSDNLTGEGWFSVQMITLGGRGVAPSAYLVRWGDKSVLFSGKIPVNPSHAGW